MAKILGKTHSPYVPDVDTHSITLRIDKGLNVIISSGILLGHCLYYTFDRLICSFITMPII